MTGPERKIQEECEKRLRKDGWFVFRTELTGERGWPDTTAHKPDRTLYIEFKSAAGSQSPQQKKIARLLVLAGHEVIVARGWNDVFPFT